MAKSTALKQIIALAKKNRKKGQAWLVAVKQASAIYRKKNKPASRRPAAAKKKAPVKKRKISGLPVYSKKTPKVSWERLMKTGKGGTGITLGTGATAMQRLTKEVYEKNKGQAEIARLKTFLKNSKGLPVSITANIKRSIAYTGKVVKASMKHITELKKLL